MSSWVGCSKSEVGSASEFDPDGVGSSGFPTLEKTAPISPDVPQGKRSRVVQRPGEFETSHEATAYWQHVSNPSKEYKKVVTNEALIYQPLNELSVHQIVHDSITPSLTMMRQKLTPHRIVSFYPLL